MKRQIALVLGLGVGVWSSGALAADLAPVYKAPVVAPAPVYSWSGFYIGGHAGYGWSEASYDAFDQANTFTLHSDSKTNGFFGGGQIGYNWVVTPNVLLGVEGDISAADLSDTNTVCSATACASNARKDDWFATARGRVGWIANNWLFYGTGGAAWVNDKVDRTITTSTVPALVGQVSSASDTTTGWAAGGGVEWGFAPNWSVKVEYLHLAFTFDHAFTYTLPAAYRLQKTDLDVDTVRIGVNYRFDWGAPIVAKY